MNGLGMKQDCVGASLNFHKVNGRLTGTTVMYVDDCLNKGYDYFQRHTEATLKRFSTMPRVHDRFDYFGTHVQSLPEGSSTMTQ